MMKRKILAVICMYCTGITSSLFAQKQFTPTDYVNPFIGTTNYGTTNPGAVLPHGLMSITPFNVTGSKTNKFDKDAQWWSTPYSKDNTYSIGFSQVNLSGVGCPDLGGLIVMATAGKLDVDYKSYGDHLSREKASPGYYSSYFEKYNVKAEVTATMRTSLAKFTFEKAGKGNILFNLGQALTNESGATVRFLNDSTIIGSKLMGTFCYNPQAVFRQYFVARVSKSPEQSGYWKKQLPMTGVEAEWDPDNGRYKIYTKYKKELSGDDLGAWFTYNVKAGEAIYVQTAVSFVSEQNALLNLEAEQKRINFDETKDNARKTWDKALSVIEVEGGSNDQKTVFYTALYHMLLHPNILQDVNGEYPLMESLATGKTNHERYTVYSLWDTYRNVHPLMCLLYPQRQLDMVKTMIDMYKESGWLPKWELYGRETYTMEGDPSIIVINDTWQRGLRDFDVKTAYEAMRKGADTPGKSNLMRPDNDDYLKLGYVALREKFDNSVSHALEYYIADWNLSQFALKAMNRPHDASIYLKRSLNYKKYYSKEYGTLRPILPNGKFLTPFNPKQGENFEPSPGFHEGNAWNYTFFVPHDIKGLAKLMGGEKIFVDHLQSVFDNGNYDPANEPDIAYPYLFTYYPREAWRTQKLTQELLSKHFKNTPNGLPGNDDTGAMSAWAIYSMIGLYPDCPGNMEYALTKPVFEKVTIHLDPKYYSNKSIVIETDKNLNNTSDQYFNVIRIDSKKHKNQYRLLHKDLINAQKITFSHEKN